MKYAYCLMLLLTTPSWAAEPQRAGQHIIFLSDKGLVLIKLNITVGGTNPQQFFSRYMDSLMTSLDANQDGTISVDEAKDRIVNPREVVQANLLTVTDPAMLNVPLDISPADRKITRQELLTYYKRLGFQPLSITYQPNMIVTMPTGRVKIRQTANGSELSLFSRLDTNADGKLSPLELSSALKTLRKIDLDDDDAISAAELNPVSNNLGMPTRANSPSSGTVPFIGIGIDESLPKQIQRLIQKYDRDEEGGAPKNKKLSASELGISSEIFAQYDGDSDGQLDFDELRQLINSPSPMVSINVDLDQPGPVQSTAVDPQFESLLRMTADGQTNINLGTTMLNVSRGPANDSITAESLLKPQFQAADRDANGYLEKSEADQAYLYGVMFENLDRDKNGKVYLDEAVEYFKILFEATRNRTVVTISEQGRTLFEILDVDRDRRLSYRELQNAAEKLTIWDQNQDGQLSENEIPLQYQLTVSRGNFPVLMSVTVDGSTTAAPAESRVGPVWFRRMDKNRDGEVSKREFLGPLNQFDKLDTDHNGYLTSVEASAALTE